MRLRGRPGLTLVELLVVAARGAFSCTYCRTSISNRSSVAAIRRAENPYPQGKNILPAKYASPLTSPLRATITRKGPNTFRFDLE